MIFRTCKLIIVFFLLTSIISCTEENTVPLETNSNVPYNSYNRINNYFGCIEIENLNAQIEVWDNSTPDGDQINLFVNGEDPIMQSYPLGDYNERKIIDYKFKQYGYNYLLVNAKSLGYSGYNTVKISVNDTKIAVESSLMKNGYVQIVIPKDGVGCIEKERSLSSIMFWSNNSTAPSGCYSFEVHIEGFDMKIIDGYWTGTTPDCGANHCATFRDLPRGAYNYNITCAGGGGDFGSGTIDVTGEPICYKLNIFH